MNKSQQLLQIIDEVKVVRKKVVRDGKKVTIKKKIYNRECKDGYKRDSSTGKCVKMPPGERKRRSKASKKSQNKSSTKKQQKLSNKKRRNF